MKEIESLLDKYINIMNQPRKKLSPEEQERLRQFLKDVLEKEGFQISDSVLAVHIKFLTICWEYTWPYAWMEEYLRKKSYILQKTVKIWHEESSMKEKEFLEKIAKGEYLLGMYFEQGTQNPLYRVFATKSTIQKVTATILDRLRSWLLSPIWW